MAGKVRLSLARWQALLPKCPTFVKASFFVVFEDISRHTHFVDTTWLIPQVPLGAENRDNLEKRRIEQLEILQAYADSGNLKVALVDAGRSIWSHYRWMKQDPAYKAAYVKVREYLGDKLEGAVFDRALNGVEKVVGQDAQGEPVVDKVYDVRREELMLKGLKPEVYNRRELAAFSDGVNPDRIIRAEFSVRLPEDGERGKAVNRVDDSVQALPAASADIPAERSRPAD